MKKTLTTIAKLREWEWSAEPAFRIANCELRITNSGLPGSLWYSSTHDLGSRQFVIRNSQSAICTQEQQDRRETSYPLVHIRLTGYRRMKTWRRSDSCSTTKSSRPTRRGGMAVLDFVRDRADLKGTKHACREGDCGACLVLVGELGRRRPGRLPRSHLLPAAARRGRRASPGHRRGARGKLARAGSAGRWSTRARASAASAPRASWWP